MPVVPRYNMYSEGLHLHHLKLQLVTVLVVLAAYPNHNQHQVENWLMCAEVINKTTQNNATRRPKWWI